MKFSNYLVLFLILYSLDSKAQDVQVGLIGGMTIYQGDFPSYRLKDTLTILANPGFGIFLRKPIGEKLAVKGSIYFSQFEGDDSLDPSLLGFRNPSFFKYPMSEFTITADYRLFAINQYKRPIEFFVLGGFGFSKSTVSNQDIAADCPILNLILPLGAGIRTKINDNINMSLHFEQVLTNSDCLDGFKGLNSANDTYSSLKVGISYSFAPVTGNSKNIGCPTF
ncbi:MAG: outer membrane beta-barrel protein [Saprospiraceae bacterium]|nr:outer membrane beta-barrel protein [Saprospiraceae bacterium]